MVHIIKTGQGSGRGQEKSPPVKNGIEAAAPDPIQRIPFPSRSCLLKKHHPANLKQGAGMSLGQVPGLAQVTWSRAKLWGQSQGRPRAPSLEFTSQSSFPPWCSHPRAPSSHPRAPSSHPRAPSLVFTSQAGAAKSSGCFSLHQSFFSSSS